MNPNPTILGIGDPFVGVLYNFSLLCMGCPTVAHGIQPFEGAGQLIVWLESNLTFATHGCYSFKRINLHFCSFSVLIVFLSQYPKNNIFAV